MKDFTDSDLYSDYRLLEDCARFVYSMKRNERKKFSRIDKDLPIHLYKLKVAARKRGTVLQFLTQHFTRHSLNTTRYITKTNIIYWRIEWIFPNVDSKPLKFVDEKCPEQKKLSDLLDKYLNPDTPPFDGSKDLVFYKSAGFSGVKVLLKAERLRSSSKKFFELDTTESLAENLSGKCILEFPIIFIVLKDHAYNFEIIARDEELDIELEKIKSENNLEKESKSKPADNGEKTNTESQQDKIITNDEKRQEVKDNGNQKKRHKTLTEIIAEEKKIEIMNEIKADKKKKPKNLLFTTGYSSEESISSSSDEDQI